MYIVTFCFKSCSYTNGIVKVIVIDMIINYLKFFKYRILMWITISY